METNSKQSKHVLKSDVFSTLCSEASFCLMGRPLVTSKHVIYDSYSQCVSALSTVITLSIVIFGARSSEYVHLLEYQNSLFGDSFVGPLPFGGAL